VFDKTNNSSGKQNLSAAAVGGRKVKGGGNKIIGKELERGKNTEKRQSRK